MSWPEVETAKKENRHEIILAGNAISVRIQKTGLDPHIFQLTSLNYLNIHDTQLSKVPDDICDLKNLQTLVLHSNRLTEITSCVAKLEKLKVLDLFRNELTSIPDGIALLTQLSSLNISSNKLESLPALRNPKLQVLDLANNRLKEFPDVCAPELICLTDLKLNSNKIELIPVDVKCLPALKNLDLNGNRIAEVPFELTECSKLKELNLKDNPITDRRFFKLIDQCRTKQVLDYIKQNCKKVTSGDAKPGKKGGSKKKKGSEGDSLTVEPIDDDRLKIRVGHCSDDGIRIIVQDEVRKVRGYILACMLHDMQFDEDSLKRFIQMQSRLHESICEKRNAATIATHDAKKLGGGNLMYTALPCDDLKIQPLNRTKLMSGSELFSKLQIEAENLRKEKKRNVYSGIHKYLYLLEGQKVYPCLLNSSEDVISFPPITNSEVTKISVETTSIFVEVTSPTSYGVCKKVLDTLLRETILLFEKDLVVEQVKNTDIDGNLKSVYPSKMDLIYNDDKIAIVRE